MFSFKKYLDFFKTFQILETEKKEKTEMRKNENTYLMP